MKKLLGRLVCLILSAVIFTETPMAYSVDTPEEIPEDYWVLQEKYDSATETDDKAGIIEFGEKIYGFFSGGADAEQFAWDCLNNGDTMVINIISSVALNVASAYENTGNYGKALEYYRITFYFSKAYETTSGMTEAQKIDYNFLLTSVSNKITAYSAVPRIFTTVETDGDSIKYYGAKFEPTGGMYYGTAINYDLSSHSFRNKLIENGPKPSSGTLIYVEFGQENMKDMSWLFDIGKKSHKIIQVAWNLPNEGDDLDIVPKSRSYIENCVDYLASLNTPVLLRFGAEMNVWQNSADPQKFIDAFRYVADTARSRTDNIAMVFSVNCISAAGLDYEMFYPGDEYVDYVGVSNYTQKYFLGNTEQNDTAQSIYLTGNYANPLENMALAVKTFGDRKPIIMSEGGVANHSNTNGEDLTGWAAVQMERLYSYMPMLYPEVKAIFYFDVDTRVWEHSSYSIYKNNELTKLYLKLTDTPYYIPNNLKSPGISYKEISKVKKSTSEVDLYSYYIFPGATDVTAVYKIDSEQAAAANEVPYKAVLDFSNLNDGIHKIDIDFQDGNGLMNTKTIYAEKSGDTVTLTDYSK